MTIDTLILYCMGAMSVSSMMMWWFNTNLQIHIVQILHAIGYKKHNMIYWVSDTPMHVWTKQDLLQWKSSSLPAWLEELTECPGCMSMHFSFWFALVVTACTWTGYQSLAFFLLAWTGWPYIANLALHKLRHK